jgi:hypothetical protein
MTGTIVAIIPKQRFDYSFLGSNLDKSVVIHKALNVIPYKTGRLMVRVHSIQMSAGQDISVDAFPVNPSPNDPQEFVDFAAGVISVTLDENNSAGDLKSSTSTDLYPYLKIQITFSQDTAGGTAFFAELSADLLVRDP